MKIVVVSAGLSSPSSTRLLADRLAAATLRHVDAEPLVIEVRDLATEIAQHLVTGFPPARLAAALDAVASADGLIAVSPVFAASYSGLFKSFFDLIDKDALTGKPGGGGGAPARGPRPPRPHPHPRPRPDPPPPRPPTRPPPAGGGGPGWGGPGGRTGMERQPSMRCWVQKEVRSVVVAAWAAALNSAVVETPYQCEVA
ncbi:NAD(P)H-dependent oxidoreductase [Streptomyces lavendulae]|uniref:NAD(P)H-dependent oxidoreductase n=1 Tax=Streptomyces lavendulae TaxID=1914 RepID=UPI003687439D